MADLSSLMILFIVESSMLRSNNSKMILDKVYFLIHVRIIDECRQGIKENNGATVFVLLGSLSGMDDTMSCV